MSRRIAGWIVVVVGCTAPPPPALEIEVAEPPVATPPPRPPGPAEQLRLELSLKRGLAVIDLGQRIEVEAVLRNRSPDPVKVVLPGPGSLAGQREPRIRWAGRLVPTGGTESVELGPPDDPGPFPDVDRMWHDEVVTIPPGGVQTLGPAIGAPGEALALEQAGRLSLTLTYEYVGDGPRSKAAPAYDPGPMAATPGFEIVSEPLVLELRTPFELLLVDIIPQPANWRRARKLAQMHWLYVRNTADRPRELPPFVAAELRFPADAAAKREPERHAWTQGTKGGRRTPLTLAPGESVGLATDLETFRFPWDRGWVDCPAFEIRVEGWQRPLTVNTDTICHGYGR
jgi:hypothetical protein